MGRQYLASMGIVLVLTGWTNSVLARSDVVPAEITRKARTNGIVRVIVQLEITTRPEGLLVGRQAVIAQRQAIARAGSGLLGDLAGTSYRVTRTFKTVPFVALEVTANALAALEGSAYAIGVAEDRLAAPTSLGQSTRLVQADQAWAAGFDGTGWAVAVLDTGVDSDHPFLADKVVAEACFSGSGNCPNGDDTQLGPGSAIPCDYAENGCKHGTHVAGIAAGTGADFSGVAKGAKLIAIQVFSRFTGGDCASAGEDPCAKSFTSDQISGLEHVLFLAAERQIAAANMSLGGGRFTDQASCDVANSMMKAAIDNLRSVGVATVIASGNDGFADALNFPGCISTAVSVASTTLEDAISSFSNVASFLSLLAPGSSITSSVPGGGFETLSGTSMASPHVAGAWAILKQSSSVAAVPKVLSALKCTGRRITAPLTGVTTSRIQIFDALNALGKGAISEIVQAPGADITEVHGINNANQIVGIYCDATVTCHLFVRDVGGYFIEFEGPSDTTAVFGINDASQVVGWYADATSRHHGFVRDIMSGEVVSFDPPGARSTEARGINNAGQIAGLYVDDRPGRHGFFRDGAGDFITIDAPGSQYTDAFGINNAGQVVGHYFPGGQERGFLWDASGTFTTIHFPGALSTVPQAINDVGQIVGLVQVGFDTHGFLRDTDGSFTLFDIPSSRNTDPYGINNVGEISGTVSAVGTRGFTLCGAELGITAH